MELSLSRGETPRGRPQGRVGVEVAILLSSGGFHMRITVTTCADANSGDLQVWDAHPVLGLAHRIRGLTGPVIGGGLWVQESTEPRKENAK